MENQQAFYKGKEIFDYSGTTMDKEFELIPARSLAVLDRKPVNKSALEGKIAPKRCGITDIHGGE